MLLSQGLKHEVQTVSEVDKKHFNTKDALSTTSPLDGRNKHY